MLFLSCTALYLTHSPEQVTSPVASTSWAAGQQQTISWQDDGATPNLQSFGPAKVTLGVGNAITQVLSNLTSHGIFETYVYFITDSTSDHR